MSTVTLLREVFFSLKFPDLISNIPFIKLICSLFTTVEIRTSTVLFHWRRRGGVVYTVEMKLLAFSTVAVGPIYTEAGFFTGNK